MKSTLMTARFLREIGLKQQTIKNIPVFHLQSCRYPFRKEVQRLSPSEVVG